jgi:hypothetical protein
MGRNKMLLAVSQPFLSGRASQNHALAPPPSGFVRKPAKKSIKG